MSANKAFFVVGMMIVVSVISLASGVRYASADDNSSNSCNQWEFYPEPIESTRYDGYLLCPSNGELWHVDGIEKTLVQPK